MKQQIANRLGVPHVRDTMMQFVTGAITREQAMESLQIGKTRLYDLRTSYLAARAEGKGDDWTPGVSGGNHMPEWPDDVQRFLKKVLGPDGDAKRYSYAFAASEVGRKFDMSIDRSQVRHWANEHGLHTVDYRVRPVAHVRRWQRKAIGELWQLDATPDYFLGKDVPSLTLIDMLDDCSRMQVGGRLYERETTASYLDLFYRSFNRFGLPLEIYVDKASFFRNDNGTLTQLGERLKFLDISFVFANSRSRRGRSSESTRCGRIAFLPTLLEKASRRTRLSMKSTITSRASSTTATDSRSIGTSATSRFTPGSVLSRKVGARFASHRATDGGNFFGLNGNVW